MYLTQQKEIEIVIKSFQKVSIIIHSRKKKSFNKTDT
jgi:hypothetical protein